MSLRQRERHVIALNRANDESLSAEWEVLVLNGLSKLMSVQHEVQVGSRNPDVLAEVGRPDAPERFVADIATAYETSYHERNPIQRLSAELHARARRLGLAGHGFEVQVGGNMEGPLRKQRMMLKLPSKTRLDEFFKVAVDPFLADCVRDPNVSHEMNIVDEGVDLRITFRPNSRTSGMTYPSFTTKYSKVQNSVYSVLKRKAQQLRDTGFEGPRGVILCAADADLEASQGAGYGLRAITSEIFRSNRSLSFVLTLWSLDPVFDRGEYRYHLYSNPDAKYPIGPETAAALHRLTSMLPEPRNSGTNALNELRFWRWKRGRYFYGSWKMNETTVQISARVLMEYLAGRMSQEEFLARNGGDQDFIPFFAHKLDMGQLLVDAEIKHEPERDDDWVIFRFGPPDPAIAPLHSE